MHAKNSKIIPTLEIKRIREFLNNLLFKEITEKSGQCCTYKR